MKRAWWIALLALQAGLVAAYFVVERARAPEAPFSWEALDLPAPAEPERTSEPAVVHFWATWCEPCRTELPSLLEAAEDEGVALLAVTDEPWPVVERYFDGEVPPEIVQADAVAAWQVSGLPDTYVVRDGRIVARIGGPRDWSTSEARAFLRRFRR